MSATDVQTPDVAVTQPPTQSAPSDNNTKETSKESSKENSSKDNGISKDQFLNIILVLLVIIIIYFAVKKYQKKRSGYNKTQESERDDPGADFNIREIIKSIKQKQSAIMNSLK